MPARLYGATAREVSEVRAMVHESYAQVCQPGPRSPFYIRYDVCDPDFRAEQWRFRRQRGRIVSALKVYRRTLHHPQGPVPVTLIGGVCTRPHLRGRGLVGPVIRDSLAYSRSVGAWAQMIVSPRRNYYLRHGYKYFTTHNRTGVVPAVGLGLAHVEPLGVDDAGWMTEASNASANGYGPIVRSETYTRDWVIEMRLAMTGYHGFKLVRRGRPVAYGVFDFSTDPLRLLDIASCSGKGADQARVLAFCRTLGRRRFTCHLPETHPLVESLLRGGVRLWSEPVERFMYYPLCDTYPIPDASFTYSLLDLV